MKITRIVTVLFVFVSTLLFVSCSKNEKKQTKACCAKEHMDGKKMASSPDMSNSIYQIPDIWTNQNNEEIKLDQLSGKIQVAAMIFTRCGYACPRIVENLKDIESQLPENLKGKVEFLLISFDTKYDTPEKLKEYAKEHELDQNWTLLHGSEDEVRTLSMALDIQYSPTNNGNFEHSNVITIFDEQGNISKRIEGLQIDISDAVKGIEKVADKS